MDTFYIDIQDIHVDTVYTRKMHTLWYIRRKETPIYLRGKATEKTSVKDRHKSLECWFGLLALIIRLRGGHPFRCLVLWIGASLVLSISLFLSFFLSLSQTSLSVSALTVPGSKISNTRFRDCFISTSNSLTFERREKEIELKYQKTYSSKILHRLNKKNLHAPWTDLFQRKYG